MNMKIDDRNKMPHLDREEVKATIEFSGPVPNRQEVRAELAKQAKAKEELVVVRQVQPVFGQSKASVEAAIYKDEASMKKIEGEYMVERHAVKASEGGEEAAEETSESEEDSDKEDEPTEADESEEDEPAEEEAESEDKGDKE